MWAPDRLDSGLLNKNVANICVGHAPGNGLDMPTGAVVQITEVGGSSAFSNRGIEAVLQMMCPHPVKFRRVWGKEGPAKGLYLWQPVPPSIDYVALGMVATTTPEPPPAVCMRCVYKNWVVRAAAAPQMVWDDSGCVGPPGSTWCTAQLGLLLGMAGLDWAADAGWDLKQTPFRMEPRQKRDAAGPVHRQKAPPPSLL